MIDQQPFVLFVLEDARGTRDQTSVHVPRSASLATIDAAANTFRDAVSGISECVFTSQRITFPAVVVPPPDAPGSTLAYHAGVFIFGCTNGEYAIISLPAIRPALLMPDGVTINQADPDVAAFIAAIESGVWGNPFGETVLTLEAAYLQYR